MTRRTRFVLVLLLVALGLGSVSLGSFSLSLAVADEGWPHLRGPRFDAVSGETGLANSWPDSGPPVLWVKELGQGYSSIVVFQNRAFTQYQTLAGQFVLCMDADSGKTLWSYRYDWPFEMTGLYPGPFSTPTCYDDHVYFSTPTGGVGCLTLDGQRVWYRELKKEFDGQGTDFGYACSPTVIDGKVILPVGGVGASIVALDARTGDVVWKSGDEPASYTPILPVSVNGQRLLIGYLQHELVGCDLETGKQLWKQTLSRGYDEHAAWPIYREPLLWTSAPFQAGSHLWRLGVEDSATCREVWHSEWMSNDVSSSVLVEDTIYGFDLAEAQSKAHRPSRGALRAMDFSTGELLWSNGDAQSRRSTDFAESKAAQVVGHASVLAADGKLFLLNDVGDLILAEANPHEYVELARARVLGGEIGWASPALDHGRLFVRNRSRAVCLYVGADRLDSMTEQMTVADLPQGKVFDFSVLLGVEPEYAMDAPTRRWLWNWYVAGAGVLAVAGVLALAVGGVARWLCRDGDADGREPSAVRHRAWFGPFRLKAGLQTGRAWFGPFRLKAGPRTGDWGTLCCRVFVGLAFVLGVVVGPVASLLSRDFVFTWPVALFVVFAVAVYRCELRRGAVPTSRAEKRSNRIVALAFLVACATFFVVCRRLSLVTQWTFLCGFPAGMLPLLVDRLLVSRSARSGTTFGQLLRSWLLMQVAFAMYFALTVAVLATKYDLANQ